MAEEKLTLEAKEAIRSYMLRMVALPGFLVAILAFGLGFMINDVAKKDAFNEAYQEATDQVLKHTEEVWTAAHEAKEHKNRVRTLVGEIEDVKGQADRLSERLNSFEALEQTDQLVEAVAKDVIDRSDFRDRLAGELGNRVETLESTISRIGLDSGSCSWETVGYNKSHRHDSSSWCPEGSFIRQLDIDSCGSGTDCPVIGQVQCCPILPD